MHLNLFNPDWAEALGWTLLHSLWQGALIFVLSLPLLVYYKNHSPQLRYNLLCLALLVLVSSMAVTCYLYRPDPRPDLVFMETSQETSQEVAAYNPANHFAVPKRQLPDQSYNLQESVHHFIQSYSGYLVNFWLFGMCFFAFRWMGGLLFTYRLKHKGTQMVETIWQDRVNQWSRSMGIRKGVQIFESVRTEVPLILGHIKPIVLLPLGILNGMTPKQVEVIIIHELAHIRRHDFLINLCIAALEMVLFYHPVYWWLANHIQQEREQCCDDIAVAVCGNARLYAQTLFLMEEKRQQNSLAMAYQGKKHHLLDRIKRICLASPASYRPEYGKAGFSLALLLAVAVMSWAKMPEKTVFSEEPSPTLIEAIATPALVDQSLAVSDTPLQPAASTSVSPALPPLPQERPASSGQVQPQIVPAFTDTIPYVPNIPRMVSEPELPTPPNFPYTPEGLEKALKDQDKEADFLETTIESYQDELQAWQSKLKRAYLNSWNDRNNQVIEAFQDWKNDLEVYRKQDKIAFMVALNKGIRYFEDELKGHENAVKKAENAVKGNLENYIKSFENQIKVHENHQTDRDTRMAVHDDRMRVHDLRMAVHDGRMDIHDQRMHIHDTRMMFHDERMKAHDVIMAAFEEEFFATIEADGYGKKSDKKLDFEVENGQVTINGTTLNNQQAQKYLQMLKKYGFEPPKDGKFFFKIGEKNRSIGTSSSYSMDRKE